MKTFLVALALGLAHGQVNSFRDTFDAAAGTFNDNQAGTGTNWNVGDFAPNDQAGGNPYVGTDDGGVAFSSAGAERAAQRAERSNSQFKAALSSLASILKTQLDSTKNSLKQEEQDYDKNKCNFEKTIKKNNAKAEDESRKLKEATAQHAKWDATMKQKHGERETEKQALLATDTPIKNACDSWVSYVCGNEADSDSLLNQLHQAVDDAALMYAALSKLAERRAEFNFGATLGLMQMSAEQTEKIELTDEDKRALSNIDGLTTMLQTQIRDKLAQPYGAAGGGVVGALKGIYDTVVSNAQRLVTDLNEHGIDGDADQIDQLSRLNCPKLALGGCDSTGANCAACPTGTENFDDVMWERLRPIGADTFSALMRTQLAQRKAHMSKYRFANTAYTDANNQQAMWANKESDASTKKRTAEDSAAAATRDLNEERSTYDATVANLQEMISGLMTALETISDPSMIESTTQDAATFIQLPQPVTLLQTEIHQSKVALTQKVTLQAQADGFTGVVSSMQKMIAQLQTQIQEEKDREVWCGDETAEAAENLKDLTADVAQLNANIGFMQTDIDTYTADIASWEAHAKDIEAQFNDDMDTCQRDLADASKEKEDASVNERMYGKVRGVLSALRLGDTVMRMLLCDVGDSTPSPASWNCATEGGADTDSPPDGAGNGGNGVLVTLLNEARQIQNEESSRIEAIHRWCNGQRDIYAVNIRNAKSNIAEQSVQLAMVREEDRKTDANLAHANAAQTAADDYKNAVNWQCSGLLNAPYTDRRRDEWGKEITALTSIIEMLTTGLGPGENAE